LNTDLERKPRDCEKQCCVVDHGQNE